MLCKMYKVFNLNSFYYEIGIKLMDIYVPPMHLSLTNVNDKGPVLLIVPITCFPCSVMREGNSGIYQSKLHSYLNVEGCKQQLDASVIWLQTNAFSSLQMENIGFMMSVNTELHNIIFERMSLSLDHKSRVPFIWLSFYLSYARAGIK